LQHYDFCDRSLGMTKYNSSLQILNILSNVLYLIVTECTFEIQAIRLGIEEKSEERPPIE